MSVPISNCASGQPWWVGPLAAVVFVVVNLTIYWVLHRTYPRR